MTKTLLALDGNSLVHRAYHALETSNLHTTDGRPSWAVKGFLSQMLNIVDRVGPDVIVAGFDDHTHSVRKSAWPDYKANRKPKPPELGQQIQGVIDLLKAMGIHVVVPDGYEADDVLSSAATAATTAGWQAVLATSDRDSFALIANSTHVLRIVNGGVGASPILTPDRLVSMYGIQPGQYRQYAAMRGDPSDNLPGMMGIGEKTAAKILNEFGTVEAALADVDAGGAAVAAAIGRAAVRKLADEANRAAFEKNSKIMTMVSDLDLGLNLDGDGPGRLPLDGARIEEAVKNWQLHSLTALAVSCLGQQQSAHHEEPTPTRGVTDTLRDESRSETPVEIGAYGRFALARPATWDARLF